MSAITSLLLEYDVLFAWFMMVAGGLTGYFIAERLFKRLSR